MPMREMIGSKRSGLPTSARGSRRSCTPATRGRHGRRRSMAKAPELHEVLRGAFLENRARLPLDLSEHGYVETRYADPEAARSAILAPGFFNLVREYLEESDIIRIQTGFPAAAARHFYVAVSAAPRM